VAGVEDDASASDAGVVKTNYFPIPGREHLLASFFPIIVFGKALYFPQHQSFAVLGAAGLRGANQSSPRIAEKPSAIAGYPAILNDRVFPVWAPDAVQQIIGPENMEFAGVIADARTVYVGKQVVPSILRQ